ncbi:undecaprenyldiphospho-muramoylpentapeptide beta-N-acetylglucosaminyltransferase [Desulfopila sp. IMCC35008]|uniref:undecaprenyldiphospho-muramoylpentapeptide beta-N-acetylglucosaminyltransferase n=1 Tax=Desulfopila sp. IMCC35008 TaxID=2653858 RepID=UPI0013D53493|nr:undecaprenyldiphospho-muramoylpentapeptide beta-N-acetylglucosaminyltransferase [Desulfopila sp. IMCC35008]
MADSKDSLRMLITGGGTGGHLFPAVAAAQELKRREPGSEVLFVGTRRKIDTTSLDQYGFRSCSISSFGLKGKKIMDLIKALAILPVSFFQALSHIRHFKPDVVLGVGGYVTGPVMVAARFAGVATVIHEQNSIPGMANRKLGKLVDRICVSLPGSEDYFPPKKVIFTGNPVRRNILELAKLESLDMQAKPTLLVLGGSQGAHAVNKMIAEAFVSETSRLKDLVQLIHQTGPADYDWVNKAYRENGITAEVATFFQDMRAVYEKADLLVSRAGATTLTEIAVLGKPAILIPYPHAADNHQEKNGDYYVQGGGALQFRENTLKAEKLAGIIAELVADRGRLDQMSSRMKELGRPDAAEKLVDVCMGITKSNRRMGTGVQEK